MRTIKDLKISVDPDGEGVVIKVGMRKVLRLSETATFHLCTAICDLQDAEDVCLAEDEELVSVKFSKKEGSPPTLFIEKGSRKVLATKDIDELVAAIGRDREQRHVVATQVLDELAAARNGHKLPSVKQILSETYEFPEAPSIPELLRFDPDYTRQDTDQQDFIEFVKSMRDVGEGMVGACDAMLKALA